jgi:hypothetical protein
VCVCVCANKQKQNLDNSLIWNSKSNIRQKQRRTWISVNRAIKMFNQKKTLQTFQAVRMLIWRRNCVNQSNLQNTSSFRRSTRASVKNPNIQWTSAPPTCAAVSLISSLLFENDVTFSYFCFCSALYPQSTCTLPPSYPLGYQNWHCSKYLSYHKGVWNK